MEQRVFLYAILLLGVWLVQSLYKVINSPLRRIPGPFYTNLTRLPLKISIINGNRIHFVHRLHQKYGSAVRIAPDEISISSLPDFKEIHRAGSGFLKTKWYEEFTFERSAGLFTMRDPKKHAERRKLFARPFSKSELRRTWEEVVKGKVQLAVSRIRQELSEGGKSDVFKWWTFLATDTSGQLMFGESFGMLQLGTKNEYIHVLESTMMGSGINSELPLVGMIGRHVPLSSFRNMFRASDYLFEYGQRAVTNSRKASGNASRNIFSGMVHESEKDNARLMDTDVAMEAGNLIVAGSDTTAITLTYLVWAVLSHRKIQDRLEKEVNCLNADFNEASLENLPFLNAVIMETLRLYGAAPGSLPRSVPEGGATLAGFYMPHGTTVSTQSFTIHRDEALFPNPEMFDPSRWLEGGNNDTVSNQAKMAFSPFGAGSRICLGIHLAWMELRLATAEFFRECKGVRLASTTTPESMALENFFLIAPKGHRCDIMSS